MDYQHLHLGFELEYQCKISTPQRQLSPLRLKRMLITGIKQYIYFLIFQIYVIQYSNKKKLTFFE